MMPSIIDLLFGCLCENYSFPQTKDGITTVSCLDCGAGWFYDANEMKRQGKVPRVITHRSEPTLLENLETAVEAAMYRGRAR